ncbi:MAG: DNA mismatch repair endonuclease MutH [Polyangiaceae bacterium]|nr:DNA mismatch repair endonuclease MutH [Polyangiaceae bacterium]
MPTRSRARSPGSEHELRARAEALAGGTLGELAASFGLLAPPDLRRAKGFVGELMERALGASAGSRAEPDFPELGVELKTLPVDPSGKPQESTFVCTIAPREIGDVEWEASLVRRKLARVLWVPVEGMRSVPVAQRRIGTALLWSPSPEDEAELRFDWEQLAGLIGRGQEDAITGHLGKWLQVRPKAAHSRSRRRSFDPEGSPTLSLPRGFYLRATFTARILQQHFALGPRRQPPL